MGFERVNIRPAVEYFLDIVFDISDPEFESDDNAVLAVSNPRHENRIEILVEWLRHYSVWQGFPTPARNLIAGNILNYADNERHMSSALDRKLLLGEFSRLKSLIAKDAPITRSGKPRNVISLTSKALWLCYPLEVPIYDSYAAHALAVIKRLVGFASATGLHEYESYISAWFALYGEIEPMLEPAKLKGYQYKIRVMDRFLWHLGQPHFNE
jgi:hypothetical protein